MTDLVESLPKGLDEQEPEMEVDEIRVAIVGRPNAGKSTLMNRILGEPR